MDSNESFLITEFAWSADREISFIIIYCASFAFGVDVNFKQTGEVGKDVRIIIPFSASKL